MASGLPPVIDRAGAVTRLERWLTGTLGARRVPPAGGYPDRWRIRTSVSGRALDLTIALPADYPTALPRISIVDPPAFGTWPHVEIDGGVCVTSSGERFDRDRPVDVATILLDRALEVIRQGIEGGNEDDFRSEFLSYWDVMAARRSVQSVVDPSGPSRQVSLWTGDRLTVVADTPAGLRGWLGNLGRKRVPEGAIRPATLLWIERPLIPREYPQDMTQLMEIARRAGGDGVALLERVLRSSKGRRTIVLIGADGSDGAAFGAVELVLRGVDRTTRQGRGQAARSPSDRLSAWRSARLTRMRVDRADPYWVHGRDANADMADLRGAAVAVVGCGSLGSQVARQLALAGVGELRLVDPEAMEWANVGRHVLGAAAKGRSKAHALAEQLRREFPASRFVGHDGRWQEKAGSFDRCDLVVSTIASLDDEAELSRWQRGRPGLPIVFGWTEPRGCASHAVVVGRGEGCFLCGFDGAGDPIFRVTDWLESPLRRQAACGSWFMPYGAGEITSAAVLTSELALDVLLERAPAGLHRVQSCREAILRTAGGEWSSAWRHATASGGPSARLVERTWRPAIGCMGCGGAGPE
jgi:molybdopterin/thiamine biosynthesis adenylyltransferase